MAGTIKVINNGSKDFILLANSNGVITRSVAMLINPIAEDSHVCTDYETYHIACDVYENLTRDYIAKGDWYESI